MKTDVNALYQKWADTKQEQDRNDLGEALYYYIKRVVRKQFPAWSVYLQDAVGESAHNIFKGIDTYNPEKGSFAQWVYGVVHNTCVDILKQRSIRQEQHLVGYEAVTEYADRSEHFELDKLRDGLTEDENRLITFKLNGFKNKAIAKEMSTTEGYIKIRWLRLCQKLRTLGGGKNGC